MMHWVRKLILIVANVGYKQLARRFIFRISAYNAHHYLMTILPFFDRHIFLARFINRYIFETRRVSVGGVQLPFPLILAAGFVKGKGFSTEDEAIAALNRRENIMPGWKFIPALLGPVEFGSFTRYPRNGNPGVVIWRNEVTQSTQNRVGLKNPGANAAALFLSERRSQLPPVFGINIAVSPGVEDDDKAEVELVETIDAFLTRDVYPNWFTLNLSCPNTEDDPSGNQTESRTRQLCLAFMRQLEHHGKDIPLWVKISPDLTGQQYAILMRVFTEIGVKAVVATNTLGAPTPDDQQVMAGVGGGDLHNKAIESVGHLMIEKIRHNYTIDVIGCGGLMDGATYRNYRTWGVDAVQYWSALIYRGPLAPAIIESELPEHYAKSPTTSGESLIGN